MTANCTKDVHFRRHMYAISTWLIIFGCAIKPYIGGIHEQSEVKVLGTFGGHGVGGGGTLRELIQLVHSLVTLSSLHST